MEIKRKVRKKKRKQFKTIGKKELVLMILDEQYREPQLHRCAKILHFRALMDQLLNHLLILRLPIFVTCAILIGRTVVNIFDVIEGLGNLGVSASASKVKHCGLDSRTIKGIVEFVKSAQENPFSQPLPCFPVIKDKRKIPSFIQMDETPALSTYLYGSLHFLIGILMYASLHGM